MRKSIGGQNSRASGGRNLIYVHDGTEIDAVSAEVLAKASHES